MVVAVVTNISYVKQILRTSESDLEECSTIWGKIPKGPIFGDNPHILEYLTRRCCKRNLVVEYAR